MWNMSTSMSIIWLFSCGKWCSKIMVSVPRLPENVEQDACVCFIRSSVIALDISQEYLQYDRKIMIYPKNKLELMVFKYNEDRIFYDILEIYNKN